VLLFDFQTIVLRFSNSIIYRSCYYIESRPGRSL